ncbi:MAG: PQQ-dependent sugar dehydrogenase [Yaniella sp.]|uniref:PQQ-dependent sugar dehydrogenase n=1 Tax=Yaniella sp. TaxID=2773929 RepID=UPI003F95871D
MRQTPRIAALTTLAACIFVGCTAGPTSENDSSSPTPAEPLETAATAAPDGALETPPAGEVQVFANNLDAPWSLAFIDGTPVMSERDTGRILEFDASGTPREVTTIEQTSPGGEGGLLGIAVHENWLYAYLTTSADNRVLRYDIAGEPGALELSSPEVIFEDIPVAGYHNGGRLAFGPDDLLYVTIGDTLEPSHAQDMDSWAGKILRLTPDGGIPKDNPFEDSPIYSYGHRNPQGLAWSQDGTLYSSEFGEDAWDELNVIEPGGNYGWPEVEGIGGDERFIDPVQQWKPAEASPSGIETHQETIFMTALRGQRLWEIPLEDSATSTEHFVNEFGRLRDVTIGPDGALWILTSNTDGVGEPTDSDDRIFRVNPDTFNS